MTAFDLTFGGETSVCVAGDWHTNANWAERAIPLIGRAGIRTILHVGDFGIWSDARGRKFLTAIDSWCEHAGVERILVTPGNHEDWEWLDSDFAAMPGVPVPLSATVQVLPRAFRFTLADRSLLSFGGAASIDFELRTKDLDWFSSEIATDGDVCRAIAGGPVEILLTHETVNGGTAASERQISRNPMRWSTEALDYSASSRERTTRVWGALAPELLLHGHMHVADEITLDDGRRVISMGRDGQHRNLGVLNLEDLGWSWLAGPTLVERPSRTRHIESQYLTRPDTEPDDDDWQ